MDRDVQAKLQKLCNQYLYAQSKIDILRPSKIPSRKRQQQAQARVAEVLGGLRDARKPVAAALVRLAYVRAMREIAPNARLGPDQELELEGLNRQLTDKLDNQEVQTFISFRNQLKRLRLANYMEGLGYPVETQDIVRRGATSFPLEQRARECALSIIQTAMAAGALAATGYDEGRNAA